MHVGLGKQQQDTESVLAEGDSDAAINSSPPCGQESPEEHFPEVVIFYGLGIKKVSQM